MKTFRTMFRTELKLSLRGMNMVIFTMIMPVIIVIILGMIFGGKPAFEGAEHTFFEQSFGASASVGICAAAVRGLPLVVSDYRPKKILRRFKVTPNVKMVNLICCGLYFPMLIFSGATVPYEVMPKVFQTIAELLTLTHGIKLLKVMSLGLSYDRALFPIIVMVMIAVVCVGISVHFFRWE